MQIPLFSRWYRDSANFWSHLLGRDKAEDSPVILGRRRVYIIPTRNGFIFALILFAMLIGAINYSNSLAFVLTFLLASLAMVSMIHTWRNLYGLSIRAGHPLPVFAGETVKFPLNIDNSGNPERFAIQVHLPSHAPVTQDLETDANRWIDLHLNTEHRGYTQLPRVTISTRFPLGLFYAWGYANLKLTALVYPAPATQRGLPPELLKGGGSVGDQGSGHDDFASLRPYHDGDSLRHIHWKALAREQGLQTKLFGGNEVEQLWLHWDLLPNMEQEQRISRLCRWVLEADSAGHSYGLSLPDKEIEISKGESHRRRCLEALALFRLPREFRNDQ